MWAHNAIWYEIFPDRFCRKGDFAVWKAADLEGTTPFSLDKSSPWSLSPWTSDFYQFQPHEQCNSKDLKTNILRRRYGGNIAGMISSLEYLKKLGVNALYISPLQYSPSLHRYDAVNYLHIDPFLGSDALGDKQLIENENFDNFENTCYTTADREILEFIKQVHGYGMKIIFDGVFNHLGYNSLPFTDLRLKGSASKYKEWFYPVFNSDGSLCDYQKFGRTVKEMPKLNYNCQRVKDYVFAALKRWLRPVVNGENYEGIDGWRIDHAIGVPKEFWLQANKFVKSLNPDALFLAELIEPEDVVSPYLKHGVFDSVMNYGFLYAVSGFFATENNNVSAESFYKKLKDLSKRYSKSTNMLMMNILGSHDTERFSSYTVNRSIKKITDFYSYFNNSHAGDKHYKTRKPYKRDIKIHRLAVIFQFTYVGAPMIYYGDEAGMWGAGDPDCRKPMVWPYLKYDDEKHDFTGAKISGHYKVNFNYEMFDFYQKLIRIRKSEKALVSGTFRVLKGGFSDKMSVFERALSKSQIIMVLNRNTVDEKVSIITNNELNYKDLLTENIYQSVSGVLSVEVKPLSGMILKAILIN